MKDSQQPLYILSTLFRCPCRRAWGRLDFCDFSAFSAYGGLGLTRTANVDLCEREEWNF